MSREELTKILNELEITYKSFEASRDLEKKWYEVAHCFSYEDVKRNLEVAESDRQFQYSPPTIYYLIQGLTPVSEKVNFKECTVFCRFCKRGLSQSKISEHEDRCRSIHYIKRQYKKWYKIELDKNKIRELYQMGEEEFSEKYDKLLHYIYENTLDEKEKTIIGFIFDLPNPVVANKFLGNS